jgi:hypothetical protein
MNRTFTALIQGEAIELFLEEGDSSEVQERPHLERVKSWNVMKH